MAGSSCRQYFKNDCSKDVQQRQRRKMAEMMGAENPIKLDENPIKLNENRIKCDQIVMKCDENIMKYDDLHINFSPKNFAAPTITTTMLSSSNIVENSLPPENDQGNVEYKSQLINPTSLRLQHLSTQMKWRLTEGDGEAIYEIGVNDDGTFTGLSKKQMDSSLETIQNMASCINATVSVLDKRLIYIPGEAEPKFSMELLVRKRPDRNLKENIRIAIIGNAQSGKSTLCGVLTQGKLDNGNGQARIAIFRHLHEFRSGKTSSVCVDLVGFSKNGQLLNYKDNSLEELLERSSKLVTLIDLAGDRKFLKTTIYGVSGYNPNYCALIINARLMSISTMTKEHFGLSIALGIPLFIVVTKIDLVNENQLERVLDNVQKLIECTEFEIKRISTLDEAQSFAQSMPSSQTIPVFCISNVTGQHLDIFSHFLAHLHQQQELPLLRNIESRNSLTTSYGGEEKPLFYVEELYRSERVGLIICGLLAEGTLAEGDQIKFGPDRNGNYLTALVESIHQNKQPVMKIFAGDSASIVLSGQPATQLALLRRGMVLIDIEGDELLYWKFTARFFLLYHPLCEICVGFQGTVYIGPLRRTVTIVDFDAPSICPCMWLRVTFKFLQQPEFVRVGMPLIFREGHTQAMGTIAGTIAG